MGIKPLVIIAYITIYFIAFTSLTYGKSPAEAARFMLGELIPVPVLDLLMVSFDRPSAR